MNEVIPTKKNGKETVTLYGTTVDVTNKDSFTLFKRDYKIVRRKEKPKKTDKKSSEMEAQGE